LESDLWLTELHKGGEGVDSVEETFSIGAEPVNLMSGQRNSSWMNRTLGDNLEVKLAEFAQFDL
jgi:hypothetical protein